MNIIPARIDYTDKDFPRLIIEVDGWSHSFTVKDYPEKHHDWLCRIITKVITEVYSQGEKAGVRSIQDPIKKALGFIKTW